ncbi:MULTISPECIES: alpha-N-arabinofuranosidase [Lactobacillus]|uniref:non-reducing end alpha-L-arabinofuranosidase n=1 Tax=Lactobacillus xujianguonis TaxID=2495899 RepID=A0A437SUZ9_9LACO|nr:MULTISPECIES: alpha-L-arabinofuranosidase C-terminal domain-containing protein [Lactobacillus]RVU70761.1 alpha-N-arabinofuranosidase [Lactobacillus xujianguonis]RVU73976.1 alpha-N-arabinofuranosidase [Lactobacillus xujianguonis]
MTKIIDIQDKKAGTKLSKYLQGQFSEHLGTGIYGGIWVGKDSEIENVRGIRKDVVDALKEIKVPVLRWPGGWFSDIYHWKDGIGENRRPLFNTSWGGSLESNEFGTNEYFDLCEQIGAESYLNVNMSSGTIHEMTDWLEYITAPVGPMAELRAKNGHEKPWKLRFVGVGNEEWGEDGQMTPEFYSDLYRLWQCFVRQYDADQKPLFKVGCGPNIDDFNWTNVVMEKASQFMDGLSLHHYGLTDLWDKKGYATGFEPKEWDSLLYSIRKMDYFIHEHGLRMAHWDPDHRVKLIVDEWGDWLHNDPGTNPAHLRQQNTIRDAVMAATTLNIFAKHADLVGMANIAQTVNVLQSMILTDGKHMILTPTYYVFDMYKYHQDADLIEAYSDNGDPINYTISEKDGNYIVSVCNTDKEQSNNVTIKFAGKVNKPSYSKVLHADEIDACNTFDDPEHVKLAEYQDYQIKDNSLEAALKDKSIVTMIIPK